MPKYNKNNFIHSETFELLNYRRSALDAYNLIDSGTLNHKALKKPLNVAKLYDDNNDIRDINKQFMIKLMFEYGSSGNIDNIDKKDVLNELNQLLIIIQKYINSIWQD